MRIRTITTAACILFLSLCSNPKALAQGSYADHSRLAEGSWYKIPVNNSGIYVITTADIAELYGAPCDKIALFGDPSGMLSASNMASHPDDLVPAAIEVVDLNGNGIFELDDYLLFYGEGPSVWRYQTSDQLFEYKMHVYSNSNYYFLTPDYTQTDAPARIESATLTPNTNSPISTYTALAYYHQDNINPINGGQLWMADKYTSSLSSRNYSLTFPGVSTNGVVNCRYGLAHISDYSGQFHLQSPLENWTNSFDAFLTYNIFKRTIAASSSNEMDLSFTYTPRENSAAGYLDFIELSTLVPLQYKGGQQFVRNTQLIYSGNISQFIGTGYSNGIRIWDITSPSQPSNLTVHNTGNGQFGFAASTSIPGTFIFFTNDDALHPSNIQPVANQNIHSTATPDYVIVTHKDFVTQAEKLADLHRQKENMDVLVLTQEQVYNEYSSGRPDPIAIRQMLRHLRSKDPSGQSPRYLLLFGKGTYDNRNILGSNQISTITFQYPSQVINETSAYPSDDVYGYLDDSIAGIFEGKLSVSIGRLPAKSVAEAEHLVDKIDGYLNKRDFNQSNVRGDWRNYVTLLADDADPSNGGDSVFASDAEKMARDIKARYPHLNIDKIFADSYEQQSGVDGSYYPDVNNALRQRINYGTLLLNYIGHGSDKYIGTERYMEFSDIEKYTNTDRLAFFVTSTCSFGHFDLVDDICGAEAFLLADAAGIGILTAARPIHHSHSFNSRACIYALDPNNSIGDALRLAKNQVSVSHCIALLGDPALRLSIPTNQVVVTRINDRDVKAGVTDSAQVLSRVTVEGEIRTPDGSLLSDFNGTIFPIVFDREVKSSTLANDNDSTEVTFFQQKNVLYKGRETVSNGRFSYSFIIPRDVAYHYDYAKLSHYARSLDDNATGQYSNIMFGGFNEETQLDELHPTVALYINDTNFRNGGLTNETPTLYAHLSDSVGINAAGSGIGHDITAIIDNNPYSTVTLNDYFQPDIQDSRNGEVYYTLGKLEEGPHTLTVKCWNIFNYSGSATIHFVVANDRQAQIGTFSAAPNPAHDRTVIRIEHNLTNTVQSATIDLYDIRGGHIQHFTPVPPANGCVIACPWDFTSSNGSVVPRGIYIARVVLTTTSGEVLTQTTKVVRN